MTASITSGQKKQYTRLLEDVAEKAFGIVGLNKDELQKLLGKGDELRDDLIASIRKHSVSNQFADEEVTSGYVYGKGYRGVKGMTEQTNLLRQFFPGVGFADERLIEQPLSEGAEGYFAIPKWEKLAPSYGEAVELVFSKIAATRKLYNYWEGKLGPRYLKQHEPTARMLQKLDEQQPEHDILVVPAQFGLRHRGRSVRRAREVFRANEFGLGAFAVGIMLLTHPERLAHYDDLWVDCAGDEFAPDADGDFYGAPYFCFYDGKLEFNTYWTSFASGYYGSVSAFLPQ